MNHPEDQEIAAPARTWVDSAESKWRVQILARRTRVTREGGTREVPSRLRRFVEGIPWAFVKPAMDYLLSKAPYSGVLANGADFGCSYRPTLTMWTRDSQQAAAGAKGANVGDATYTLVQDLVEADSDDVYMVGTSSSCSETVESDYVWDAAEVQELPQGSVGVTYQIAGLRRNEDGTFDYALVKRVALTQDSGWSVTEDNAFRRVRTRTWDNVYPGPDGQYLDDTGTAIADIPQAGASGGVEVKLAVSENQDCTLKISATEETSVHAGSITRSSHTQYEGEHGETEMGSASPLPPAPDAAGGIIRVRESRRQPDGSFQNEERTTVERPVPSSRIETVVGRKGVRSTVKDTNMRSPADVSALHGGLGTVVSEKTPGGLFNNTTTTLSDTPVIAGRQHEETAFKHVDAVTTGGGPYGDLHPAGGVEGKVRSYEYTVDEEGAVIVVERTDQEKTVPASDVTFRVTRDGVTRTVKDSSASAASVASNVPPAYTYGNIGKVQRSNVTPGGWHDNETVEVVGQSTPAVVSASRQDVLEQSVTETDTLHPAKPSAAQFSIAQTAAANGVHVEKSVRLTELGTYVVTVKTTTERETTHSKAVRRTPRATVTTTVVRNAADSARPVPLGAQNVQVDHEWERTPGGRYNVTVTDAAPGAQPDADRCARTVFSHEHDTVTFGSSLPAGHVRTPGGGHHYRRQSEVDQYGIVRTVETDTEEVPSAEAEVTYESGPKGVRTTTVSRNQPSPASRQTVAGDGSSFFIVKSVRNPGGSYDNSVTRFTRSEGGAPIRTECSVDAFQHVHSSMKVGAGPQEAADAANGVHHQESTVRGDDGSVTHESRTTTEKPVTAAEKAVDYDAFHKVTTVRDTSQSDVSSMVSAEGYDSSGLAAGTAIPKTRVATTLTKGALHDIVEVTDDAIYRQWDDELDTDLYKTFIFYFRNASAAQRDSRRRDAYSKWADLKSTYGGSLGWSGGSRSPTSARISVSSSLNDYNLFDGHYVIELAWAPETGGSDNDHVDNMVTLADWAYTVVATGYSVGYEGNVENAGRVFLRIVRTRTSKSVHESIVSGWRSYVSQNFSGTLIEGSHVSVTPSTGTAHGVVITKASTDISIFSNNMIAGAGFQSSYWW